MIWRQTVGLYSQVESEDSLDENSNDSPSLKYDYHLLYECLLDTILVIENFEIFCLRIKAREIPLFELRQ